MARIGLFALNLSPRSGGVHSLIAGLVHHAHLSRHEFLYVAEAAVGLERLPPNVQVAARRRSRRVAMQAMMNLPGIGRALHHPGFAKAFIGNVAGLASGCVDDVDLWLWPHCFRAVPRLGRVAVICHDLIHRHHPELFSRLERFRRAAGERSLRHCAGILCPSDFTARDLVRAVPDLPVAPMTVSAAAVAPATRGESQAEHAELRRRFGEVPLFLFVAVDWPHKNHRLLIDAALRLRQHYQGAFRIVFAGRRRAGMLASSIASAGAQELVTDLGEVSAPMLAALYERCSGLLFPSLFEGFGIPLVEAMSWGRPVLASNRACIPEVCGGGAALLPADDAAAWAEQMKRLLEGPAYREEMAGRASARARVFSWEHTWGAMDRAIGEILAATPAAMRRGAGQTQLEARWKHGETKPEKGVTV